MSRPHKMTNQRRSAWCGVEALFTRTPDGRYAPRTTLGLMETARLLNIRHNAVRTGELRALRKIREALEEMTAGETS